MTRSVIHLCVTRGLSGMFITELGLPRIFVTSLSLIPARTFFAASSNGSGANAHNQKTPAALANNAMASAMMMSRFITDSIQKRQALHSYSARPRRLDTHHT